MESRGRTTGRISTFICYTKVKIAKVANNKRGTRGVLKNLLFNPISNL
jgi:hypothetical protein